MIIKLFRTSFTISFFVLLIIACGEETEPNGTSLPDAVISDSSVTDIDGNVYSTVRIGDQVWMAENLKTTRLNDGTLIENVSGGYQWTNIFTPAYCWLNNDPSNKDTYGALYNWYTVNTDELAPAGWHVPSEEEFITLINYLGGESLAGERLFELGFIAQGAGQLATQPGEFNLFCVLDKYWTTTSGGWEPTDIKYLILTCDNPEVRWSSHPKSAGHSVRCIKDH